MFGHMVNVGEKKFFFSLSLSLPRFQRDPPDVARRDQVRGNVQSYYYFPPFLYNSRAWCSRNRPSTATTTASATTTTTATRPTRSSFGDIHQAMTDDMSWRENDRAGERESERREHLRCTTLKMEPLNCHLHGRIPPAGVPWWL